MPEDTNNVAGGGNTPAGTPAGQNGGDNATQQGGSGDGTAQNTGQGTRPEHVPYDRFAKTISEKKALEDQIAAYEKEREGARQKQLEEQGEYKKLLEEQAPKVERATKLEGIVSKTVEDLKSKIPEDKRGLIPASLPLEDQLEYIHTNMSFLMDSQPRNIGHATNPGGDTRQTSNFTQEQISDPKFYTEHREEILKAQREGRLGN